MGKRLLFKTWLVVFPFVPEPVRRLDQVFIEMDVEPIDNGHGGRRCFKLAADPFLSVFPEVRVLDLGNGGKILLDRACNEISRILGLDQHTVQAAGGFLCLPVESGIGHFRGIDVDAPDVHHPHDQGQHHRNGDDDEDELVPETAKFHHRCIAPSMDTVCSRDRTRVINFQLHYRKYRSICPVKRERGMGKREACRVKSMGP